LTSFLEIYQEKPFVVLRSPVEDEEQQLEVSSRLPPAVIVNLNLDGTAEAERNKKKEDVEDSTSLQTLEEGWSQNQPVKIS
jgi:hypothetical protein